nr:dynamin family protein [Actinomycetota bacterium]
MREALADTEELFMLVIVGEFNAGKSAFTNALLGEALSPEGITPTTDEVLILKYGAQASERRRQEGVLEKAFPNDVLREVSVVDTPGTNAVIRHHEELSRAFVPRSDLVLFVTSAQRPFTESERAYLEVIRDWGKKIVFVMNNSDVLGGVTTNITRQFVREQATKLIGSEPPVFMVSAKLAQEAKQASESLTRRALV